MAKSAEKTRHVEYVALSTLTPHPRNPRVHKPELLQESYERFGFTVPILLCERTRQIAAGHGRWSLLRAMEEQGKEPPEGIVLDESGTWKAPVIRGWASKDDAELLAYVVADNRQTESSDWDFPKLAEILAEVNELDLGLTGTAFTVEALEDIMIGLAPPPTLDELEEEYGEYDEIDSWPTLRLKVSPSVRDLFNKLKRSDEDDAGTFTRLVREAHE